MFPKPSPVDVNHLGNANGQRQQLDGRLYAPDRSIRAATGAFQRGPSSRVLIQMSSWPSGKPTAHLTAEKCYLQWRRQLWGTGARVPLDFQQFHF